MAGGQVSASDSVKTQAGQLKQYVNGDLPNALNKLTKLASNLNTNSDWKGKYANEYHQTTFPSIQKSTKQMHTDLQQISKSLSTIVDNILQAGGNG